MGFSYAINNESVGKNDKKEIKGNYIVVALSGLIFFRVFLYIQKRVHKEVFFEMKQRTSEQEEFKTIFNELDEGIIII